MVSTRRLCILISVVCVLTAFGAAGSRQQAVDRATRPQPGFDPNDVVRQVGAHRGRDKGPWTRCQGPGTGGEGPGPESQSLAPNPQPLIPSSAFLLDTTSTLVPAPGSHLSAAVGFDGTNYLVVWENQLGGSYSNICGARVTPQGTVLDPSGILISDAAFDRGSPALCYDGANFLVVWQDYRKGWAYYIYGARVTPGGQVLDPIGFAISKGPNDARNAALSFDGTNFLVTWEDYNNDVNNPDIYGARVTPAGTVLDTANFAICTAAHGQYNPVVSSDGTNLLVAWADRRDTTHVRIYGARVTPAGAVLDVNGFAISYDGGSQSCPDLGFDGANYLVAWRYYDDSLHGIHGSRVTPGGTVLDPSPIVITQMVSAWPVVGFDGANSLVVWYNITGLAPQYFTLYGARVTPGGAVLDTGSAVITISRTEQWSQTLPAVGFDGANYLAVWQDERNQSGEPEVYGARVSPGGGVLDTSGFLITRCARGQYTPAVAFDGTNFLTVWEDDRNGYTDIYGARVTPGGDVLDPDGIAICQAPSWQYNPVLAFDGANYLVVWQDHRNGLDNPDIYGARVTPGGQVLDPAGIAISQAPSRQFHPAVAYGGGNYLVAWQDYRSGQWDIYGTRVTPGGFVLNTDGIAISQAPHQQTAPAIGFDGANFLLVWADDRVISGMTDIYGARVTPAGVVLDASGFAVSHVQGEEEAPALAYGGSTYFVAWEDYRRSVYSDIFGARVTTQGTVLDSTGIALSTAEYDQLGPAVAFDDTNFVALWEDCCTSGNPDIYGTKVSPAGAVFGYGRVVRQDGVQSCLALGHIPGSHLFLAYQSWTGTTGNRIYNTDRIWGEMDPTLGQGIEETPNAKVRMTNGGATIVRGVLFLPKMGTVPSGTVPTFGPSLLDISGRKVLDLKPGANDVRALAPGVYFVWEESHAASSEPQAVLKVVVTR